MRTFFSSITYNLFRRKSYSFLYLFLKKAFILTFPRGNILLLKSSPPLEEEEEDIYYYLDYLSIYQYLGDTKMPSNQRL